MNTAEQSFKCSRMIVISTQQFQQQLKSNYLPCKLFFRSAPSSAISSSPSETATAAFMIDFFEVKEIKGASQNGSKMDKTTRDAFNDFDRGPLPLQMDITKHGSIGIALVTNLLCQGNNFRFV